MIKQELLDEILNTMAVEPGGTVLNPPSFGKNYAIIKHHIDILVDKGLVQWQPPKGAALLRPPRITAQGYDFLAKLADENDKLVKQFRAAKTTI